MTVDVKNNPLTIYLTSLNQKDTLSSEDKIVLRMRSHNANKMLGKAKKKVKLEPTKVNKQKVMVFQQIAKSLKYTHDHNHPNWKDIVYAQRQAVKKQAAAIEKEVDILFKASKDALSFIVEANVGNWSLSGIGMSYSEAFRMRPRCQQMLQEMQVQEIVDEIIICTD